MPRQRRTHKAHVDLASLIERAQQQLPYSGRPSRIQSRIARGAYLPSSNGSRSREVRSGNTSRNAVIGVGTHAIWNTLVQPISLLKWMPLRRSMHMRRSCRSRSQRSQPNNNGGVKSHCDLPKIDSQPRMPAAKVQPSCATELPTVEVQISSDIGRTGTPSNSTVILHQNPRFDAEGDTQSGLLHRGAQKAKMDQVKSRWNVRRDKTPKQQFESAAEPQDAVSKNKSGLDKKIPAKKGSDLENSSAASVNSPSSADSGASSTKSKTDTEESNSYEENIDLTTQAAGGVRLEERVGLDITMPRSNVNATNLPVCTMDGSALNLRSTVIDLTLPSTPMLELKDEVEGSGMLENNEGVATQFESVTALHERLNLFL